MAYDVEWLRENEVIHVDYRGVISREQLNDSFQEILDKVESVSSGPVFVLLDARKTKKVRFSAQEMMHCEPLQKLSNHHYFSAAVVYGVTNVFARYLIMVTMQMRSNAFASARTEVDAYAHLVRKGAVLRMPA